jgi:hypothetical protein
MMFAVGCQDCADYINSVSTAGALVHALLKGHHAFSPCHRVCELCWDLLPADAQSVSTVPSCVQVCHFTLYIDEDVPWRDQADVMLSTHPSVFEATSGEMSTVWVGSVETLISMIRSPLYSTSKCTAGRGVMRSVPGYAAEAANAQRAVRAMPQLLFGSRAL